MYGNSLHQVEVREVRAVVAVILVRLAVIGHEVSEARALASDRRVELRARTSRATA